MKNLNLKNLDAVIELDQNEILGIEGGSIWGDLAYVAGMVVHGLVVFATEGGNNAGLCVR